MPTHHVTRQFRWEAAHRLACDYDGKCAQNHGHSWLATVQVTLRPGVALSEAGFVIDFAEMKRVQHWLDDYWDYATLVDSRDQSFLHFLRDDNQKHYVLEARSPSSEELCAELLRVASELLDDDRCYVSEVRIAETCSNEARLTRDLPID